MMLINKLAVYISGFVVLFLLILVSNRKYIFDERNFVPNLTVIEQYGFSEKLFTEIRNQSPGPLYQIVHYLFKPLTQYNPIAMRVLNYVFLCIIVALILLILKSNGDASFQNIIPIIAIPMIWPVTGMALSEIPAMLFCSAAIVLFIYSMKFRNACISYGTVLMSGLCFGLSVIGRSPYLVVFIPFLLFVNRENWKKATLFFFSAVVLPVYAFILWNGLVPPDLAPAQTGWNFWYGMLGLGYLASVTFLVAPGWYSSSRRTYYAAISGYIVFSICNILFIKVTYFPLRSTMLGFFGDQFVQYLSFLFPGFFVVIGLFFILQSYRHFLIYRTNLLFIFSILSALFITATTVKSSAQFSSRYIAQCIPFIALYSIPFYYKKYTLYFHLAGMIIGACSLISYYIGSR